MTNYNKKPKPFKWRYRDCGCGLHKAWTYKRNYQAVTYDVDGDRYRYCVYEVSDKKDHKTVLIIEDFDFDYDIHERCEQLLRKLAKGKDIHLNDNEIRLLKNGYCCIYEPENIQFQPYKEVINEATAD